MAGPRFPSARRAAALEHRADETRLNLPKAFRFGLRVCGSLGIGVMLKSRSKKEIPVAAPSLGRTDASF